MSTLPTYDPATTPLGATDQIYIEQGAGVDRAKRATVQMLLDKISSLFGGFIQGGAHRNPTLGDLVPVARPAASGLTGPYYMNMEELSVAPQRVELARSGAGTFRVYGMTASGSYTDSYDAGLPATVPMNLEVHPDLASDLQRGSMSLVIGMRASVAVSSSRPVVFELTTPADTAALLYVLLNNRYGPGTPGANGTAYLWDTPGVKIHVAVRYAIFAGATGYIIIKLYKLTTGAEYTYADLVTDFGSSSSTTIALDLQFSAIM